MPAHRVALDRTSPRDSLPGRLVARLHEPGENSPFSAMYLLWLAQALVASRTRLEQGWPFVIHWIHVSIFFPQQNVRRT